MRRRTPIVAVASVLAAALAGLGGLPAAADAQPSGVKTVFLIVMSNRSWSGVKGNPDAPYINGVLLPTGASANSYYASPGQRLALPNALWLEAGTAFNVVSDADPGATNRQGTASHLTSLLMSGGVSWRTYQEGADKGCQLNSTGYYRAAFNPFVYFDDVASNTASCLEHVRPYQDLAADLAANTVARYNFIKPSPCHSMHEACPALQGNAVRQGDDWLAHEVPQILASPAYQSGGAVIVTWDHGDDDAGSPIGLIVLSPLARKGYVSSTRYTHGSTLRTLQQIFGVTPLLGDAAAQAPLDDLFAPPATAGATVALTWAAVPGATSYTVRRATSHAGPFDTVAAGLGAPTFTDRGLVSGTTYYYAVSATNASGEGPASAPVSVTPVSLPPAPTNVVAKQAP